MNEILTLCAVGVIASSGLFAALAGWRTDRGDRVFVAVFAAGAVMGLVASLRAILGVGSAGWSRSWPVPGGELRLRVDALAGMFLTQVFLIGLLSVIYGLAYFRASEHPIGAGRLRVAFGLAVAGMVLLVAAANSILFLAGWEVMALSAFLCITCEDRERTVREVGFVYLVSTRVGTLCVFATFALLRALTGSFSLDIAGLSATAPGATAAFVLGFAGFGLKAGVMPLHIWLPGAHANAPTHVSAFMSGALIKMGIYGLLRLTACFGNVPLGWGTSVFIAGCVSAVLGVVFAIGQHDIKRLLAYHSVENIGIIVMGVGVALIGRALSSPALVALGLAGALLHTWNHGLFKGLLFLAAGSVIHAAHTREIDALGGLSRTLPKTALAFLVGAVAISGLPPLNGFVSELFIYLGMLRAGTSDLGMLSVGTALGVPILALVGALASLCFAKVYGIVFLGAPRSTHAEHAREAPRLMLAPMAVLAGLCVLIGVGSPLLGPVLDTAAKCWPGTEGVRIGEVAPLRAISVLNGILIAGVALVLASGRRARREPTTTAPTWDCGYAAPTPRMQYTASSFAGWIVGMFGTVLRPRVHSPDLAGPFPKNGRFESHVPEVVLDLGILPVGRLAARGAGWFRWIQSGSVHVHLLYVLGALLLMLFFWR